MDGAESVAVATVDDFDRCYGDTSATLHILPKPGLVKIRRVNILVNVTNGVDFCVHNNSINNLSRAVLERVFLVKTPSGFGRPPQAVHGVFDDRLSLFKSNLRRRVTPTTPISLQEFADSYEGRKHTLYCKAVQSLTLSDVVLKDSYVQAFVKAEKINLSAKINPAPRVIQPRSPRYNASLGVYIKPIEKRIYSLIDDVFGAVTVAKCYNAKELGAIVHEKWTSFAHPCAVGLDASRFDQHCGEQALRWEHSIYEMFYPGDKRLRMLLSWQLRNKCFGGCRDGELKYTTLGCRMSGDMNTGLGNCLLMCAMVHAYMEQHGVKYHLINNGDDCVLFLETKHLRHLVDIPVWFTEMGYNMVIEKPVYQLEHLEFCQTKPVYDGLSWLMVRNPNLCVTKDLLTLKCVSTHKEWSMQKQAISDCGLSAYGCLPVYNEFYRMLQTGVKSRKQQVEGGLFWVSQRMSNSYGEPSVESRISFWAAFAITPDQQELLEESYRKMTVSFNPGSESQFMHFPAYYGLYLNMGYPI